MEKKPLKRPQEYEPLGIKLTEEQKKQIVDYMQRTGHQVAISLNVEVVEGKIAPASVSVGAV